MKRRTFVGTAGLAMGAALILPRGGEGAELTASETANVRLVNDFVASVSTRDMAKVLSFLSPDAAYRMTETTPPAVGPDAIRARLGGAVEGATSVTWEILETFAKGPMVMNHRIDRFVSPTRPFTWEGVGIFFIKNDKIAEWSDYTIRLTR